MQAVAGEAMVKLMIGGGMGGEGEQPPHPPYRSNTRILPPNTVVEANDAWGE